MQRKQLKQNRSGGGKPPKSKPMPIKPPAHEATVTFGRTLRFQIQSTAVASITRAQLLNLMVMGSPSANTSYRMADAVKVRRVRIWGNPPGVSSALISPTAIQWFSENGPTKIISDNGMGSTYGAKVSSRPPSESLAGFWSLTGTNEATVLFDLFANTGDIVDVELSFRLQNQFLVATGSEAVTTVITSTNPVPGVAYCLYLDNGSTNFWMPVDQKTLT
jgi:hypothetical protein